MTEKEMPNTNMLVHDDLFTWEGFGGIFHLAAGKCRLRIFDLRRVQDRKLMHLKPHVVVVSDLPEGVDDGKHMSVRSCTSHIATCVAEQFHIDPHRMLFVEYYPSSTYGTKGEYVIAARLDLVEFEWHDDKALHPKCRPLTPPMSDTLEGLIAATERPAP
jgi:hypothetical protein